MIYVISRHPYADHLALRGQVLAVRADRMAAIEHCEELIRGMTVPSDLTYVLHDNTDRLMSYQVGPNVGCGEHHEIGSPHWLYTVQAVEDHT